MEKSCVSIWVGHVEDEDSFYAYTRIEFDDDDNYVCVFAKDFQIDQDDIDEDFIEVYWKREKLSPVELLEGCSYYDNLKDEVEKFKIETKRIIALPFSMTMNIQGLYVKALQD